MKIYFRRIALSILAIYVAISCYTAYQLVVKTLRQANEKKAKEELLSVLEEDDNDDWNPWGLELEQDARQDHRPPIDWQGDFGMRDTPQLSSNNKIVEIWGKAAIGNFLWEHIIEGRAESRLGGVWHYGSKAFGDLIFRYRTGPGVVPAKVPNDVENLILVLNGREDSKVDFAQMWLDYLPNFHKLKNIAVIMLGNEQCDNNWIKAYMTPKGGLVQFVFIVYDSPDVDDHHFYQWPLGVATYRNFPVVNSTLLPLEDFRPFQCNFLGTVYVNSSREHLLRVIRDYTLTKTCYINPRLHWIPSETGSSQDEYLKALSNSDLTLCPVGINTECYRIYEAMAYGSVPLVEDVLTPGHCGTKDSYGKLHLTALRLLKRHGAPIMYVKNWNELPEILQRERRRPIEDKVRRRKEVINWYASFRNKMRDRLIQIILKRFFNEDYGG